MNAMLHPPPMTLAEFFDWSGHLEGRYEFDGSRPVEMTGVTARHTLIVLAIHRAMHRLLPGGWLMLGPELGIATVGNRVRCPGGIVTRDGFDLTAYLVPDPVVVFEVVSKTSGRLDRVEKAAEYEAVSSIRHYVVVEPTRVAATVFGHPLGDRPWTSRTLADGDALELAEPSLSVPIRSFYDGVTMPERLETDAG